jgi:hypothetical protein
MREATTMFDRVDALENCVAYLALHWCENGRVPADSAQRDAFVQRIVDAYVTPLKPTADWDEKLTEAWHKEKVRVSAQMAIAAAKIADEQDSTLIN